LINKILPGAVKKINKGKMPFVMMVLIHSLTLSHSSHLSVSDFGWRTVILPPRRYFILLSDACITLQQENINNFLSGARAAGVPDTDLFMTVDLFEAKNMVQVVQVCASSVWHVVYVCVRF
jgi:hypothetical protein